MISENEKERTLSLLKRIELAEKRVEALLSQHGKDLEELRQEDPIKRIKRDLLKKKVFSHKFISTPKDYYDLTLEQRAGLLNGKVPQLCKSIIFENTACDHYNLDDRTNSRFYCVIIQYICKSLSLFCQLNLILFMSIHQRKLILFCSGIWFIACALLMNDYQRESFTFN